MAAAPPAVAVDGGMAAAKVASQAFLETKAVKDTRVLIADLYKQFYGLGWVSGTGGSITIRPMMILSLSANSLFSCLLLLNICCNLAGVQKERMEPEDMYVLATNGSILSLPSPKPYPHKPPKCSECAPLFLKAYDMRNAGAVIHSPGSSFFLNLQVIGIFKFIPVITHMEMIKGIQGHGYYDELVVPIIENTAYENELTDSLAKANKRYRVGYALDNLECTHMFHIEAYQKTTSVLVRNHGIYIWGDSWISAKTQAECYHYLFDAAIKLHQMGLDWSTPDHGPIQKVKGVLGCNGNVKMVLKAGMNNSDNGTGPLPHCIVLDIEGPTTPITFVADVLFPYAHDNVGRHLSATYETAETHNDIKLLCAQVEDGLKQGIDGAVPIPTDDAGKEEGHIWRTGYENNELEGVVYGDVPEALEKWHALGIKVYIYSSGSRLAQRLIFGKTNYGDLRKYLSGFFDTTVGNKKETHSYIEISESLGVNKPSDILFLTDVFQEAVAAKAAGLEVMISIRPGNTPLPDDQSFKTITSFAEI
ncbi:hypothetical protein POTOM_041093 [Populus tomentosa]|uniref:Class II aldolase/adducin N-terminal domain-containing protein n=1 Tax=Populus tomentosa TaxID=118781 RepID=A0A8X8CIV5_POPTO|nr:hypothetical protein POTOM_041093 [Populus tomentosa]